MKIAQFYTSNFRFGLIKLQKPSTRLMAFASDSDSDGEPAKKKISIAESSSQKRQARIIQADALKEDPTIFQYDEVYDEMSANREEAKKAKSSENRQSKYISKLLVTAEKRKLEYESRLERKVQKERDAEGDQFKDKEVFVTAAYREKLEALKKAEQEAEREEYLESIGDVCKQNDLSGFYRHVYEQKLGNDKTETEPIAKSEAEPVPEIKKRDDKSSKRRTYRKHSDNEHSDSDEQNTLNSAKNEGEASSKKVHLQSNLDADSDFSIDSDSDSDSDDGKKENETQKEKSEQKTESHNTDQTKTDTHKGGEEPVANGAAKKVTENDVKDSNDAEKSSKEQMPPPSPPPPKEVKPKIDIWKKRTVGDVYLAAVKRYYERKQAM